MSLADELLADLDDIENDDLKAKLSRIKEEPVEIDVNDSKVTEIEPMDVEILVSMNGWIIIDYGF